MRIVNIVILGSILLFLNSCKDYKQPVFEKIDVLKVHQVTAEYITLKGKAAFLNPNQLRFKINKFDVDVINKEKKIAVINHASVTVVKANDTFYVPFVVKIPTKEFKGSILSNVLGFLNGRKIRLKFLGELVVSKFGRKKNVPIAYAYDFTLNK